MTPPPAAHGATKSATSEAVCAVVAEDRATAEDAVELIEVDYDPLPAVTDPREGEKDGSPRVHDTVTSNHLIKREYERGEPGKAFADAHLVVRRHFRIHRKQALCLEGRGVVAAWREGSFQLTLWISHQLPYVVRHYIARHLGMSENDVRIVGAVNERLRLVTALWETHQVAVFGILHAIEHL